LLKGFFHKQALTKFNGIVIGNRKNKIILIVLKIISKAIINL